MGFKKKAKAPKSQSNVDWNKFNEHLEERVEEAVDENGANLDCFVSMMVDSGTQPPDEEYSEYKWEDNEQQNKLLKKDFGCKVVNDIFMIPNQASDSVIIAVDFPDIMVDYGKFFSEDGTSDERPYRHLLAGEWQGVAGVTRLAPKADGYTPRSMVTQIAKAANLVKGGKVPANFDLSQLMGAVFTMDVELHAEEKGDNFYVNVRAKNVSARSKKLPPLECEIDPIGIMLNLDEPEEGEDPETYNEDELKQINAKMIKRLALAEEWEDSDLKEALVKLGKVQDESEKKPSSKTPIKPASTKKTKTKVEQEPDEEPDSDDNPFFDEDDD